MRQSAAGEIGVAFSPDGRYVLTSSAPAFPVSCGEGRTVRFWDAATGEPVTAPLRHPHVVGPSAFSLDGRRVVTGCNDGTVWVWNVASDPRSTAELRLMAQVQASRRIDATGGAVTMTPAELRRAWQTLRAQSQPGSDSSPARALAWHRREAAECEQSGAWALALTHLQRPVDAQPDDPLLRARRANAYASVGRWNLAGADYARVVAWWPASSVLQYAHALIQLARGDADGYRRTCAVLARHLGPEEAGLDREARRIAATCALAPRALADVSRPVAVMEWAVARRPGRPDLLQTLGALLYRAGRFEEAAKRLDEAITVSAQGPSPRNWLYLAMAHHHLGHRDEARRWLAKAVRWIDSPACASLPWQSRLELHLLRREAERLIRTAGPSTTGRARRRGP
jgi:Flp pilus assembly protein TadD